MSVKNIEKAPLQNSPESPAPELPQGDEFSHVSDHTMYASDLAKMRGVKREGLFAGRPTIGRDTYPIEGYVDIRSWGAGGESIVVDSEKEPEGYDKLRNSFLEKISSKQFRSDEEKTRASLEAIFEAVSETIDYDPSYAENTTEFVKNHPDAGDARKINLSNYLMDGKGVCRHMALACSWLAGDAQNKGLLDSEGKLTAEVNQNTDPSDLSAHEWGRYTSPDGKVYILDPAQGYFGTLEDLANDSKAGKKRWEYFRNAQEKKEYQARAVAETVIESARIDEYKFSPGQSVTVERTSGEIEDGWEVGETIVTEDGSEKVIVFSPDGKFEKTIRKNNLYEMQPKEGRLEEEQGSSGEQASLTDNEPKEVKEKSISQVIEEVNRQIEGITNGISESDSMNLWRYASGTINKAEAQKEGNGQESTFQGQLAGSGYMALSEEAKKVSGKYLRLMQEQSRLLDLQEKH